MSILELRPRKVAGFLIDYHAADPDVGGVDVVIWRNARRDDGFLVRCSDWGHAHRLLTDINALMGARQ